MGWLRHRGHVGVGRQLRGHQRGHRPPGRDDGVLGLGHQVGCDLEQLHRRLISALDGRRGMAGSVDGRQQRGPQTVEGIGGVSRALANEPLRAGADRRVHGSRPERRDKGNDRDRRRGERPAAYHASVDSADDVRALPKAELHQHLDGSVRPSTAVELAAAIGMDVDIADATARMVGPERCRDQAELLTFFDLPIALLQTRDALERVTAELLEDLADDGVRYAEIRWAPRLHLANLSVGEVLEAVASGIARAALELGTRTPLVGLIVTAMRSHPPTANVELARRAANFGPPIIGFDLAGAEAAWPAPPHAAAFDAAREGGLALTAHAGEVEGAQRLREVLDFGVRRIAHGVTAATDPSMIELLRERDVTLDLCPTSNVQAGIVPDLPSHPIAQLHRAGVSVTLSTDDRTVTGTSLSAEMAGTADAVGLLDSELAEIALNAFDRAFAPRAAVGPIRAAAARAWDAWRTRREVT